jgi:peptidyl-prolyl cis-trans isomerase SurA
MEETMNPKNRALHLGTLLLLILAAVTLSAQTETIERIYAVVNDQLITFTEMKNTELQMTSMLSQQFKDEELKAEIAKMKENLLDTMIRQKLLLSKAMEKKYDIDFQVDSIIKNLKVENNIESDEDLRKALAASGMDYDTWRRQISQQQMQMQLIYEDIGSKITIDNAQIMAYYREHIKDYTVPLVLTLDAVYLPLSLDAEALATHKADIDQALSQGEAFAEMANRLSQLPAEGEKARLGSFKSGELDPKLEEAAKLLTPQQSVSPWVETENGWYRLALVERVEEHLMEYKDVRPKIEEILREGIQEEKLKIYVEDLKRVSYIKIIE